MNVAHFKAGTLAGQTARPERRDTTLVGDLGQRIVLVHELRQLAGAEEFLDRRRHRLGVDQVLRHQAFAFGHRQAFLDRALDAHQAHAELVLGHFADAADAPVTEVVDIVDVAETVTDVDQFPEHRNDIVVVEHARPGVGVTTQATVELHATDAGQVVAIFAEEQVVEQRLGGFLGRRLAGAHHAVDLDQRLECGTRGIQLAACRK